MKDSREQKSIFFERLKGGVDDLREITAPSTGKPIIDRMLSKQITKGTGKKNIMEGIEIPISVLSSEHIPNDIIKKMLVDFLQQVNKNYIGHCNVLSENPNYLYCHIFVNALGDLVIKLNGNDNYYTAVKISEKPRSNNNGKDIPVYSYNKFFKFLNSWFRGELTSNVANFLSFYGFEGEFERDHLLVREILLFKEDAEKIRYGLKTELMNMIDRIIDFLRQKVMKEKNKLEQSKLYANGNRLPESHEPVNNQDTSAEPLTDVAAPKEEISVPESHEPTIVYAGARQIEKGKSEKNKKKNSRQGSSNKKNKEIPFKDRKSALEEVKPICEVVFSNIGADAENDADTMFIYPSPDKNGYIAVLEPFSGDQITRVIHLFDEQLEQYKNENGTIAWGDVAHYYGDMALKEFRKLRWTTTMQHGIGERYFVNIKSLILNRNATNFRDKNNYWSGDRTLRTHRARLYDGELAPNIAGAVEKAMSAENPVGTEEVRQVVEILNGKDPILVNVAGVGANTPEEEVTA